MNAQVIYWTFSFTIVACRVIIFKLNIERRKKKNWLGVSIASEAKLQSVLSHVAATEFCQFFV